MLVEHSHPIQQRMESFQKLLRYIENSDWEAALEKGYLNYNIKNYNIRCLNPVKVRQLYLKINEKFYITQRSRDNGWLENQLRVFVWIFIITRQLKEYHPQNNNQFDWVEFIKVFQGKSIQTCKFQYKSILYQKPTSWNQEQSQLLNSMIKERDEVRPNWNQISRQLFNISGQQFFKTANQCREHWNNFLNKEILRTPWSKKEDYILMKYVVEKGKQWAPVAKLLQRKRTQHMVKNRYISIVQGFAKKHKIAKKFSQSSTTLQKIYQKAKVQYEKQRDTGCDIKIQCQVQKRSCSALQLTSNNETISFSNFGFGNNYGGVYNRLGPFVNYQGLPLNVQSFYYMFMNYLVPAPMMEINEIKKQEWSCDPIGINHIFDNKNVQ